jgi:hypothetical protein
MNHVYLILGVLAYSVSLALYLGFLNTGKRPAGPAATLFLGLGIVAHYFACRITICTVRFRCLGGC